jgi:hypothetical protein
MTLILAPFYILFGVLYLGGTIIGLCLGRIIYFITESRSFLSKEWLGHNLLHRSAK